MPYAAKDRAKQAMAANMTKRNIATPSSFDAAMSQTGRARQNYPKRGFKPKTSKQAAPKARVAAANKAAATRGMSLEDVFAVKPDRWQKAQERILGKGRM